MENVFKPIGLEYERFLYAVVGNEANGMQLTMASAIARSGADPWTEAALMSRMPKGDAVNALSILLSNALGRSHDEAGHSANIERMLTLLPHSRGGDAGRAREKSPWGIAALATGAAIFAGVILKRIFGGE